MPNQNQTPPGSASSNKNASDPSKDVQGTTGQGTTFGQGSGTYSRGPSPTPTQSSTGTPYTGTSPSTRPPTPIPPRRTSAGTNPPPTESSTPGASSPPTGTSSFDHSDADSESGTDRFSASFAEFQSRATETAKSTYDRVVHYAKENPKMAAGVGIAAGLLLARRLFRR